MMEVQAWLFAHLQDIFLPDFSSFYTWFYSLVEWVGSSFLLADFKIPIVENHPLLNQASDSFEFIPAFSNITSDIL